MDAPRRGLPGLFFLMPNRKLKIEYTLIFVPVMRWVVTYFQ